MFGTDNCNVWLFWLTGLECFSLNSNTYTDETKDDSSVSSYTSGQTWDDFFYNDLFFY